MVQYARRVQDYLWGDKNDSWPLEEWKRMFEKRICKIDDIDPKNPHADVELKKRLIQNAALCINLLSIIELSGIPGDKYHTASNLPQYTRRKAR